MNMASTSKAPNNEESVFVKLAKHLGVVVLGRGIIKGMANLCWKHILSNIQNKNKTKQVLRQYYKLTGKHHHKQSPHGIQMETYPVTT